MQNGKNDKLNSLIFLNDMYRKLIINGRTYAAFDEKQVMPLVDMLANREEIFDPMSGYGSLMTFCAKKSIKSYSIEINVPTYLWQILVNPSNVDIYISAITRILNLESEWPKIDKRADTSDEWFTDEAKQIILKLLMINKTVFNDLGIDESQIHLMSISLLLPFVSRISTCTPGDVTYIKEGGICVYRNLHQDYRNYLELLLNERLKLIKSFSKSLCHKTFLADARNVKLPERCFSAMITSPPYPNYRDYAKMFAPENYILKWLDSIREIKIDIPKGYVIGTNVVKGRNLELPKCAEALKFLKKLEEYQGTKKAVYDNKVYYLPYFRNYFYDILLISLS